MSESNEPARARVCSDIAELLPAYLNRSLEKDSTRRLEAHLATCSGCRQEERDTRTAWSLFEGHLPVEMILDYALGQSMPGQQQAMIESHLEACERCSAEVTAVRQEDAVSEPALRESLVVGRASKNRLQVLAWAACLTAVVASAGWIWTWQQLVDERAFSRALTARANLPVVELLPATHSPLRQGSIDPRSTSNRVILPEGADELVLVLLAGGNDCDQGCLLEIYEAGEGQPKQRVEGFVANSDGHLTMTLPVAWLPAGAILVVVDSSSGKPAAEYVVEISP